jgi:hypothetical protein
LRIKEQATRLTLPEHDDNNNNNDDDDDDDDDYYYYYYYYYYYIIDKPSYLSANVRLLCWKCQAVEHLRFSGP